MATAQHFDAVVIGGGSGLTAAYYALQDQRRVALVTDQPEAMGGTCVNFGCIPTKTLIHSAEVMQTVRDAARFGIHLDQASVSVDFAAIMDRMRRMRADNAGGARQWVESSMTPIYSRVRFVDDKTLETADGQRISGEHIFIATGASAAVPPIDGLETAGYWTNEEVLELTEQPRSLIVIGGGYIGAELGYLFAALGTEVTLINGDPLLLKGEDEPVREVFTEQFGQQVRLITGRAVEAQADEAGRHVVVEDGEGNRRTMTAQRILLAAGRRPNTAGLALAATGVECDEHGAIRVDGQLRTTHPDIYAYGDVIGQAMYKHTSSHEGELAWRNACGAQLEVDYRANPHAVFSAPQIGSVGLTERECQARGLDYRVACKRYDDVARGQIIGASAGFARLLVEQGSDRILGFHMIGPDAAALIHEVVVAMSAGDGSAGLIHQTIHIHPTMPELIRAVFDAAQ